MIVYFYKQQLCGAITPHQGLCPWLPSRARDSSLPISIATITQWLIFCSSLRVDLGCSRNYTRGPAVSPEAFSLRQKQPRAGGQAQLQVKYLPQKSLDLGDRECQITATHVLLLCESRRWTPPSCPRSQHTPSPPSPGPCVALLLLESTRKSTWGFGNLENTWFCVVPVRLGTISPKTTYIQIHNSDFMNIEATLNDCVKL